MIHFAASASAADSEFFRHVFTRFFQSDGSGGESGISRFMREAGQGTRLAHPWPHALGGRPRRLGSSRHSVTPAMSTNNPQGPGTPARNPADNLTQKDRIRGGRRSAESQVRRPTGQFAGRRDPQKSPGSDTSPRTDADSHQENSGAHDAASS